MIAGLLVLAGGGLLAAAAVAAPWRRWAVRALDAQAVAVVLLAAGAAAVLAGGRPLGAAFHNALTPALGLDRLSAFFLLLVAVAALPALLHARAEAAAAAATAGAAPAAVRALAALTAAFVLALALVLVARDAGTFLAGWELMTAIPAAAILVVRRTRSVRRAIFQYIAINHLGGVGVWVALLVLAHAGAIGGPPPAPGVAALVAAAALVGFGTKAGLVPLHAWLPRAHPLAPSHISALMSGVMVKVALYGLIRVLFGWDGPPRVWVGAALLGAGALSALAGIAYALVQRDLKRLLAFSTIENVGIVALGLGASLLLAADGAATWSALAFAAALLHAANHTVFKALLFLATGTLGRAAGTFDSSRMGGLLGRVPWSGWAFLVGCAAIAGLPPLGGFASEWLTLRSLLELALRPAAGLSLAGALAAAALAATAALALLCFVKVAGLVLLGPARGGTEPSGGTVAEPRAVRAGIAALAALCLLGGLFAGALAPTLAELGPGGVRPPATVALRLPGTGGLPTVGIAAALAVLVVAVWLAARRDRAAPAPAWACGQRVEPALEWTATGFTTPLRLALAAVLRPRRELTVATRHGVVQSVAYRVAVPHHFDTLLYGPVRRAALRGAEAARRLQSGSLRAYLAVVLAVVLAVLALLRTGALA